MYPNNDLKFRLFLLGDHGVGKTSILDLLLNGPNDHPIEKTIGLDLKLRTIEVEGKTAKLLLFDSSGDQRFRVMILPEVRSMDGIILVFDVTNESSFKNLETWLERIGSYAPKDQNMILVGTKIDQPERRVVEYATAKALAEQLSVPYFETSRKEESNLSMFLTISKMIKDRKETANANNLIQVVEEPRSGGRCY
ncbi:MAG: P-loop containing nucleoside triphosphate hydrolase protein [Benniella sp.]|nr:MAG: P-loop containing nucleoside triphosphate hydrolase protein [Benniella sp.]